MPDPYECPFCRDFEAEDRLILAENNHALVFSDAYPAAEGHALIVSKRHVGSVFLLAPDEYRDLMLLIPVAWGIIVSTIAPTPGGYTIGINDGPVAGQTVPHVHIHLIPRHEGDVPNPRGGIRQIFTDDPYINADEA